METNQNAYQSSFDCVQAAVQLLRAATRIFISFDILIGPQLNKHLRKQTTDP